MPVQMPHLATLQMGGRSCRVCLHDYREGLGGLLEKESTRAKGYWHKGRFPLVLALQTDKLECGPDNLSRDCILAGTTIEVSGRGEGCAVHLLFLLES